MQSLYEQYRPQSFADVIGQDKILARIDSMRKRNALSGKAYFFTGGSGTGKTTIARLIAAELADPFMIEEIDAPRLTVDALERIERTANVMGWGAKTGRAFIINEAHALRKSCIEQFLTMLERIPPHVVFLFTTVVDGVIRFEEDVANGDAFLSRCVRFDLARRDLAKPFAERLRTIAAQEGYGDIAPAVALKAVQVRFNNMRACLVALESGELSV